MSYRRSWGEMLDYEPNTPFEPKPESTVTPLTRATYGLQVNRLGTWSEAARNLRCQSATCLPCPTQQTQCAGLGLEFRA